MVVPRSSRGRLIKFHAVKFYSERYTECVYLTVSSRFERGVKFICWWKEEFSGRMAKLADAIALGAIGATLGGSNPLPPKLTIIKDAASDAAPGAYWNCAGARQVSRE